MTCKDCNDVTVNRFTAYQCKHTGETLHEYLLSGGEPVMPGCPKGGQEQLTFTFEN